MKINRENQIDFHINQKTNMNILIKPFFLSNNLACYAHLCTYFVRQKSNIELKKLFLWFSKIHLIFNKVEKCL